MKNHIIILIADAVYNKIDNVIPNRLSISASREFT